MAIFNMVGGGGAFFAAALSITNAEPNTEVTAARSGREITVMADANGEAKIIVTAKGTYTITNGIRFPTVVEVSEQTVYSVRLLSVPTEFQEVEWVRRAGLGKFSFTVDESVVFSTVRVAGHYKRNDSTGNLIIFTAANLQFITEPSSGTTTNRTRLQVYPSVNGGKAGTGTNNEANFDCTGVLSGSKTNLTMIINGTTYTGSSNYLISGSVVDLISTNTSSQSAELHGVTNVFNSADDSGLVAVIYPVRRIADNVIGFYDVISETFVESTGGTISCGGDVL